MNEINKSYLKVSIVLVTHKGTEYIREAVDSCLNQTYKNIELIIVDDASADNTQEIIKSYSDKRIKYLLNETNLGLANSLNRGFSCANGDYLTWTSYDNVYLRNAIEVMIEELEKHKNIDFVYTNFYRVDEKGNIFEKTKVRSIKDLDIADYIGYCFLYRRKIYEELGGYNPSFNLGEDYEYWLRVRRKFRMKRINKYLYCARYHKGCLRARYPEEIQKVMKEVRDKYIVDISLKDYFRAEEYFLQGDKRKCIPFLMKSILGNPLNLRKIRLLILIALPVSLVRIIRKAKSYLLKLLKT